VRTVADCVDECDRQQSCRAVDVNETAMPLISCRLYINSVNHETIIGNVSTNGVAQFVAERCPEDGSVYSRN